MKWFFEYEFEERIKTLKVHGVKTVCSKTRSLGRYMGDNIQVFYDMEDNEVFGIYHLINEWSVYPDNPSILYVGTFYEPATQKEIEYEVRLALENHYHNMESLS